MITKGVKQGYQVIRTKTDTYYSPLTTPPTNDPNAAYFQSLPLNPEVEEYQRDALDSSRRQNSFLSSQNHRRISEMIQIARFQSPPNNIEDSFDNREQSMSEEANYQAVGIIEAIWRDSQNRVRITNFGTVFAISSNTIVTCQHNIFFQQEHLYASQVIYVPGVTEKINGSTRMYKSKENEFFRAKQITRYLQTFKHFPLVNEICLIGLEKSLNLTKYIEIGALGLKKYQSIEIIGYPSSSYFKQKHIFQVTPDRSHLKGKIIKVTDEIIIVHDMPTKRGHSGSPILALGDNNQVFMIGVHTHRGPQYSYGLFLNGFVSMMLKNYFGQLKNLPNKQIN